MTPLDPSEAGAEDLFRAFYEEMYGPAVRFVCKRTTGADVEDLLSIAPMPDDRASVLARLARAARSQPDQSDRTQITTQSWSLAGEVGTGETVLTSYVSPTRRVSTVGPTGIVSYTVFAGRPYDAKGNPVADPQAPVPGTDLGTVTIEPDERLFPDPPPTDPGQLERYLADAVGTFSESPAANAIQSVRELLSERVLNPAQNAAVVEYLATLPDLELAGTSVDRLGRSVTVFRSPTENGNQQLVLLSAATGGVTAVETVYLGTNRSDITAPAVIDYITWEDD